MAKDNDLEQYIRNIRDGRGERQNTLDWYLRKVRGLAKKEEDPRALNVLLAGQEAIKEQKKEQTTPVLARDEATQVPNAVASYGSFSTQLLGKMIFYMYDAKYKEELPYWDQFPLVFPISSDQRSFLGMNMHYLPPVQRAKLLAALMNLSNTTSLNLQTKLVMTYKLLNSSSKYIYFKPCLKKYLFSHMRSRVTLINPEHWVRVLFLPTANFLKASEDKVWQDSVNAIRGILYKK